MEKKENGFEAFARTLRTSIHDDPQETLRDRFAMAALTGMLAYDDGGIRIRQRDESILPTARMAYRLADAMLEARKRGDHE